MKILHLPASRAPAAQDDKYLRMPTTIPPKTPPRWLSPTLIWVAVAVVAIGIGLYATPPEFPRARPGAGRMLPRLPGPAPNFRTLLYLFGVGSVVWYAAAVALPLLVLGARRIDIDRYGRARTTGLVVAVVASLIAITSIIDYAAIYRGSPSALRPGFSAYAPQALRQNVLPWVALVGLVAAIEARRRAARAALDRERLRAKVAEQRLIALTGQLHPHFLFNTLQGISTLIHRDPEAADEMLAKLSDLLRDLLRHREHVLVALTDEVRYARTYLEIAKLRFADRLQFQIDVGSESEQASVPLFILQPLVENALAHGIGGQTRGGCVRVTARRDGDWLRLEVADDGAGLTTSTTLREGIGLSNTRERLRASFGDDHRVSLGSGREGGAVARIDIPFRLYQPPAGAQ
jgi:signal transduction histidine kinase